MAEAEIALDRDGRVGVITLDRPDKLNAYTPDMGDALIDAFRQFASDSDIGAILLRANGRAFCAGADKAFLSGRRGRNGMRIGEEYFITGFASELFAIGKPILAAINGPAIGIGATMLLPLDIRIAAESARFGFPFSRMGLMPGMGSTVLLPALVGHARAKDIILSGANLTSGQALEAGLVSDVHDDAALDDIALQRAHDMAGNDAAAMAAGKQALSVALTDALQIAIKSEQREAARLAHSRDTQTPLQPT